MNKQGGYTIIELLVYISAFAIFITVTGVMYQAFDRAQQRLKDEMRDIEVASRFLENVKEDLRAARQVTVEDERMTLTFPAGESSVVRFDPADFTVRSDGRGGDRRYEGSFETVRFSRPGRKLVAVEIELKVWMEKATYRPRWYRVVYCRNLDE